MEYSSKLLEQAVFEVAQLPGIGKRSAMRLVLHLLKQPAERTENLANSLQKFRNEIKFCKNCHNLCDEEWCEICINKNRDTTLICVVEDVRDVIAIENTGFYKGFYHVLGGKISPIDGVGPNQLNIRSLIEKVLTQNINEVIFALSATIEGDTTMFYIVKQLGAKNIIISTIARGIAVGDELEYADELTLGRSIQQRIPYKDN